MTLLAAEPRPRLHVTPPSGWLNDPVGGLVVAGRQHLFYQYVPGSTRWQSSCHWGHLAGTDLVRLRHLPVALAPGQGDDGVWSGSAVLDAGGPVLIYTGVRDGSLALGRVGLARPEDAGLEGWRKHAGNPVLEAPEDPEVVDFRDPHVSGQPGAWLMTVGAGLRDGRGAVLRYRSADLENWAFLGVLASGRLTGAGAAEIWECPQYVELGDRPALIVSVWAAGVLTGVTASRGAERDGTFIPDRWQPLDQGGSAYALTTYRDLAGRLTTTSWLRHDDQDGQRSGWTGMLSLPSLLSAGPDGQIRVQPHPDIDTLRVDPLAPVGDHVVLPDGVGDLECDLAPGGEVRIETDQGLLRLVPSPDGVALRSTSGSVPAAGGPPSGGVADGPADRDPAGRRPVTVGPARVRLVVDRGVLEAWTADGRWGAYRLPYLRARSVAVRGGGRLAGWSLEPVQAGVPR